GVMPGHVEHVGAWQISPTRHSAAVVQPASVVAARTGTVGGVVSSASDENVMVRMNDPVALGAKVMVSGTICCARSVTGKIGAMVKGPAPEMAAPVTCNGATPVLRSEIVSVVL